MQVDTDIIFEPLPALLKPIPFPFPKLPNPLGPLASLPGSWGGDGFNVIWRPNHTPPGQDRFLELNLTSESIKFDAISGQIPNRGLLQIDINMFGITYLQQISDANLNAGLHIEPGIWAVVPATQDLQETSTVVRMASIPHGTTILAQGSASTTSGAPNIPNNNILPFTIGNPASTFNFPEQNLSVATAFRSPAAQLVGITQAMVNNPNSVLQAALAGQTILSTTTLRVSTLVTSSLTGGGTSNTSFLQGKADSAGPIGPGDPRDPQSNSDPNARSAQVDATFWIELVEGSPNFLQLQYSQTVMLNFNGLSWPHITVGTLKKSVPVVIPPWMVNPPKELLDTMRPTPDRVDTREPEEHAQDGRGVSRSAAKG